METTYYFTRCCEVRTPLPLWEVELMETQLNYQGQSLSFPPLPLWEVELMETLRHSVHAVIAPS